MANLEVLRSKNDYLLDLVGRTYNRKTLNIVNSFYKDRFSKYSNRNVNKFSLVTCLDNARKGKEILSIGGSSLLRNKKTGDIFPNLILANFGLLMASALTSGASTTIKDDTGANKTVLGNRSGGTNFFFNLIGYGNFIQMGSGSTAPTRGDFKIQTALGNAPESGYLATNTGSYTASDTIIYQADANPTGGSGTVNEIISAINGGDSGNLAFKTAIARDIINPSVSYASTRLLRGSYTWQF